MRTDRRLIVKTAGLGAVSSIGVGLGLMPLESSAQLKGEPLKLFAAPTIDGQEFKPESFAGKVSLVYFWASWCPYCLRDLPTLRDKQASLKDKGFNVLGVNLDKEPELALKWAETYQVNFPSVKFTEDYRQTFLPAGVRSPVWWLAGRDGLIVDFSRGEGAAFAGSRQRRIQIDDLVAKG